MPLGLRESRVYERRRRQRAALKWVLVLGTLAALVAFAYQIGAELANLEVARLKETGEQLRAQLDELKGANASLQAEAAAARAEATAWHQRYREEVPTGDAKTMLALIAERLEAGVSPERLRFMVEAATDAPSCTGEPTTKRFLVRTPIYQGANDAVSFADSTVTVMAEGESASDANGNPEAWYDPAKPVTIRFSHLGGRGSEATGLLPLHHSIVRDKTEYRFTIAATDRRGFVAATAEECSFP